MNRTCRWRCLVGVYLGGCLAFLGCNVEIPVDQAADVGQAFRLEQEPPDSIGVEAAFATLADEGDSAELTLVGRIPKEANFGMSPWSESEATFAVVDAESAEGMHDRPGHDPDNCPFCKRRQAEGKSLVKSLALIQLVDAEGEVVPQDVRPLLGLKEDQVVVAKGLAHRDPLGNLVLAARGIFVRPDSQ